MFRTINQAKQFKAQTIFRGSVIVFMIRSTTMDLDVKFNHSDIVLQTNEPGKNDCKVGLVEIFTPLDGRKLCSKFRT